MTYPNRKLFAFDFLIKNGIEKRNTKMKSMPKMGGMYKLSFHKKYT
jgi:hypothetical protein